MKRVTAIKKYMGLPGNNPEMNYAEPKAAEMKAFLDVCSDQEKTQFGRQACEFLGETFEE
jgi:hypothetical protein